MLLNADRLDLLARIAEMYYESNLTQDQIAKITGYSRSMVSRLLTEARRQGVVEIRINHPMQRRRDLEQALQARLHLDEVWVMARGTLAHGEMLRRLGVLAARFLEAYLHDYMTLGTSWGTAVYETVNALQPRTFRGIRVVQMIGALGTPNPDIDGPELARRMARALAGQYATLPVPLIVESETTRQSLMRAPHVQRVTQFFRQIDLALVGVGTVEPEHASLLRAGYLTAEQLEDLRAAGAVGDVCAIHIALDGSLVDTPLTRCILGIDAETLRRVPIRIGVAGGQAKALPILAASRSGLINRLVTDEVAATFALRILEEGSLSYVNATEPDAD
ncbi:sugar-binding transcriptional regulator [Thermanaerothrix daxensis]|nr:sugar-binding transcriptional regulator [Thermanaerothrix daxensis]